MQTEPDAAQLAALRRLRRFRPLNGIVWALTEQQSAQPVWMDKALRMLQKQAQHYAGRHLSICGRCATVSGHKKDG
ncbi:hypothetical protein [Photorhabdus thracensis]|uniref:hypothetical protein n=1 Tax=Photorhabdus thracensis TaxID=230089 RepID=UPI0013010B91|nr:hypothetical protein [Photorhabdus thracensis]